MANINILYTTVPDAASADRIAKALVEQRLAACVNAIAGMRSTYRWEGAIETADEIVLIAKTTAEAAQQARNLIVALHPYDTPCVIAVPVSTEASNAEFLAWIVRETGE